MPSPKMLPKAKPPPADARRNWRRSSPLGWTLARRWMLMARLPSNDALESEGDAMAFLIYHYAVSGRLANYPLRFQLRLLLAHASGWCAKVCQIQTRNYCVGHVSLRIPVSRGVVGLDHFLKPFGGQDGAARRAVRQSFRQKSLRQRILGRSPAFANIEKLLGGHDSPSDGVQLLRRDVPTADARQQVCAFGEQVGENAAKKLAENQRIHQGRSILGFHGQLGRVRRSMQPIGALGEVNFVGAGSVMIGPPAADGEAQGHGLQSARLIAGDF